MPELPEVEVLVRHLRPLLLDKTIRNVTVNRRKVIAPTSRSTLNRALVGSKFLDLQRRGKFMRFALRHSDRRRTIQLLGHLGMSGRMFVASRRAALPKHAAVVLDLGRQRFVYEDPRYFGRFTLDTGPLELLGPEPDSDALSPDYLSSALARSNQPVKVKLLDQTLVAGLGNIYASEALFCAGISPRIKAARLKGHQIARLIRAIRKVLAEAIRFGSTVPLHHGSSATSDGLFYFGQEEASANYYEERLRVYDREDRPCRRCRTPIRRIIQAARSTYFCPHCQR